MTLSPARDCLSPALLRDRVILVTGSSRGIGRAVALSLGLAGARVGAVSRDREALGDLEREFRELGIEGVAAPADVTDRSELTSAVDAVRAAFGPINALVANAGLFGAADVLELEEPDLDNVIAVNLKGTLNAMQATVPDMKRAQYGKVVTVGSAAAVVGSVAGPHYSAAKGAIISLTRSAARQLAPFGVRVNCINPGAKTQMVDELLRSLGPEAEGPFLAKFLIGIPTPEEVAGAYVYLCSALSDGMTGQVVNVDGGYTL